MSYCPLVERLGFDENFMDVTEMVEKRLAETPDFEISFKGHVYGHVGEQCFYFWCVAISCTHTHLSWKNKEMRAEPKWQACVLLFPTI